MHELSNLIGGSIQKFDSLDSTNNYIANNCETEKMAEGTVILAKFQTAGKGRYYKRWHSQTGLNLTFSFLLRPKNLNDKNHFLLTKWVSSAICLWMEGCGFKPQIKLPNDIYIKGKKCCGILIENKWQKDQLNRSVVGIGININQGDMDDGFDVPATSLFLEDSEIRDLDMELNAILAFLSYCFSKSLTDPDHIEYTFLKFLGKNYSIKNDIVNDKAKLLSIDNRGYITFQKENKEILKGDLDEFKLTLLS